MKMTLTIEMRPIPIIGTTTEPQRHKLIITGEGYEWECEQMLKFLFPDMQKSNTKIDIEYSSSQFETLVKCLIKEIKNIADEGILPDGDSVGISTLLWAENWRDEFK